MKNDLKVLALIPARGGSKGIPRKNIYPILGKPLIYFSIEAAKKTPSINRVIVTTDDQEIADIAKKLGAEVPFIRPPELAGDDTPDLPVFQHALTWLKENEGYEPDLVVHLWPTSPLRRPEDLEKAVNLIAKAEDADSLRSISNPSQNPFKMWRYNGDKISPILKDAYPEEYADGKPEPHSLPRQVLPTTYVQTGYVAIIKLHVILKQNSMFGKNIIPFFHDENLYTEFDSFRDVYYAEQKLKKYIEEQK